MAMNHCETITEARGLADFYRHYVGAHSRLIKVVDGWIVLSFWGE